MKLLATMLLSLLSSMACKTPSSHEYDSSLEGSVSGTEKFATMKCAAQGGISYFFVSPANYSGGAVALYDSSGNLYDRQFLQGKIDANGGILNDNGSKINIYSFAKNGSSKMMLTHYRNGQLVATTPCTPDNVTDGYVAVSCRTHDNNYKFASWPIVDTYQISGQPSERSFVDGTLKSDGSGELKTQQKGRQIRFSISRNTLSEFWLRVFVDGSLRDSGSCQAIHEF